MQELAPGGDLYSYLESHQAGCLPEVEAAVIIRQLLDAVEYLHQEGVAHRDIKPENVLMTSLRANGRVILTDFGQARKFDTSITPGSPAKSGRMHTSVGTANYQAPFVNIRLFQRRPSLTMMTER